MHRREIAPHQVEQERKEYVAEIVFGCIGQQPIQRYNDRSQGYKSRDDRGNHTNTSPNNLWSDIGNIRAQYQESIDRKEFNK